MRTLRDLLRGLRKYDETTVVELLDIRTEDLLDRFEDKLEERFEEIEAFLDDEDYEVTFDDDEREDD